jgi:hypothetical protein
MKKEEGYYQMKPGMRIGAKCTVNKKDLTEFNEGKAKLQADQNYLSWLHELTIAGYGRNIFISPAHADAIMGIYALKDDDSIDKCLDMYLNFKRRWKALNEPEQYGEFDEKGDALGNPDPC